MTPTAAGAVLRAFGQDLIRRLSIAERLSLFDVRHEAEARSRGGASLKSLRRANHPYARRHGAMRLNPDVVNVQSGQLLGDWQVDPSRMIGGELTGSVYNSLERARYIWDESSRFADGGTKYMFGRPIHQTAAEAAEPRREERLDRGVNAAWDAAVRSGR